MKIKISNIEELARDLIADIGNGPVCSDGDLTTDYFVLAEAEAAEQLGDPKPAATVALLYPTYGFDRFYTVHLVDDINCTDCELYFTDRATEEQLVELLREIAQVVEKEAASKV
jgi:hypothetical protein